MQMFRVVAKLKKQINTHMLSGKNEKGFLLRTASFTVFTMFMIIIILSWLVTLSSFFRLLLQSR